METSQRSQEDHTKRLKMSDSVTANQQVRGLLQGSWISTSPLSSFLGEYLLKFYSLVKSQSHISLVLAIAFAVILLMQVNNYQLIFLLSSLYSCLFSSPTFYGMWLLSSSIWYLLIALLILIAVNIFLKSHRRQPISLLFSEIFIVFFTLPLN